MARLDIRDDLPEAIAHISPAEIRDIFPNPTLIRVAGDRPEALYVSTLLHGNETSSFHVLQNLARICAQRRLRRSLIVFVGNVDACAAGVRTLPGQVDMNRVWAGGDSAEHAVAQAVLEETAGEDLFASIDIHNNTGANPFYGCPNQLLASHVHLASLFSRIVMLYDNPPTIQSIAFSKRCPSVTIECGMSGNMEGVRRATEFVLDVNRLTSLNTAPQPHLDLDLYESAGRILMKEHCSFVFGDGPGDVRLPAHLDAWNFSETPAGAAWAEGEPGVMPFVVLDETSADITERCFRQDGSVTRQTRQLVPAMLTTDPVIVRQDCLGYLMEPVSPGRIAPG